MDNRWVFKCSSRYNFACEKENNLEFTGTGADCSGIQLVSFYSLKLSAKYCKQNSRSPKIPHAGSSSISHFYSQSI